MLSATPSPFDNAIDEICKHFNDIIANEKDVSAGMATICTLLKVLERSKSETVQELQYCLQNAVDIMRSTDHPVTAIASGSELFLRFITLAALDTPSFAECKKIMLQRGDIFYKKLVAARGKIAKLASKFITDGSKILIHSRSRVILQTMKAAVACNKIFEVYVTESLPDSSGIEMCQNLKDLGISCTLILDSAMGYIMEQVDMVMVGAEGVAESGGIINKVGTYTMAICAKEMKKPLYVLTESFKFSRIYPLNQVDLPDEFKYTSSTLRKDVSKEHPLVDYTPPHYISLLFTDLGILTPSAISDELIKLYL
ncbi:translation initiation factor eIF-2B subunit alpha [Copidosoma floridanum]|uniref:translation initiation factor eIF-2B subunit alpha n=1 Tax=Copidosoma floridanum TaxID=29053 RepID=UPI0006C9B4F2|nr:translation initiation factor eIF-2B subunit alpha [Copidosoma floridanum]